MCLCVSNENRHIATRQHFATQLQWGTNERGTNIGKTSECGEDRTLQGMWRLPIHLPPFITCSALTCWDSCSITERPSWTNNTSQCHISHKKDLDMLSCPFPQKSTYHLIIALRCVHLAHITFPLVNSLGKVRKTPPSHCRPLTSQTVARNSKQKGLVEKTEAAISVVCICCVCWLTRCWSVEYLGGSRVLPWNELW